MKGKVHFSIRKKILMLSLLAAVPFLAVAVYLLVSMSHYNRTYHDIVSNLTVANQYNLDFKEMMDESLYKMVVGYATFDNVSETETLVNPYDQIYQIRRDFKELREKTSDTESALWINSLLRNIDTLEDRVGDIDKSIKEGGAYDKNIKELDNNIYILTDLVQDDIQHYIYYQTLNMDTVTDRLSTQVKTLVIVTGGLIAFLVAVMSVFAFVTSAGILKPMRLLSEAAGRIAGGDLTARAKVHSQDEVEELADSFNSMAESLGELVGKVREEEEKRRKTDLRLLQEQINPHFLYNTLDTIVWLIEVNEPDQAVDMVVTLSDFFRLVLSKGKEFISIRQEEQHIRSYLQIQEKRYHDILDYEIRMDPRVYDYEIPKLTLQPLVENALYHGIKYKRSRGSIWVRGELDGNEIHLYVRDDGVGMAPEELGELRKEIERPCKETEKGFGLANVNERIRMYFGNGYGMRIQSEKGKGTEIELTIPARPFMEHGKEKEENGCGPEN